MEPTEDLRIAQHNSLQELAHHYDSINWNMHTIFVALHVALVGWLVISIAPPSGSLWKDDIPGAVIGLIASFVGWWLAIAWRRMFERHRLFIKAAYQRLRAIETSLTNGDGNLANFKVHTLMRPAIAESRSRKGDVATSAVILRSQGGLTVVYIFIGLLALGRALYLFPSAFDQLRSCLSATVG